MSVITPVAAGPSFEDNTPFSPPGKTELVDIPKTDLVHNIDVRHQSCVNCSSRNRDNG